MTIGCSRRLGNPFDRGKSIRVNSVLGSEDVWRLYRTILCWLECLSGSWIRFSFPLCITWIYFYCFFCVSCFHCVWARVQSFLLAFVCEVNVFLSLCGNCFFSRFFYKLNMFLLGFLYDLDVFIESVYEFNVLLDMYKIIKLFTWQHDWMIYVLIDVAKGGRDWCPGLRGERRMWVDVNVFWEPVLLFHPKLTPHIRPYRPQIYYWPNQ